MIIRNEYRIEGDTVWIQLTHGKETCVDLQDWPAISGIKWRLHSLRKPYAVTTGNKSLHRVLMGCKVDHKDRNGLNNKRSNLRPCTTRQNNCNRSHTKNTSGFRGVSFERARKKWRVSISYRDKEVFLGRFHSPLVAALAYDFAARSLNGEFAVLNFPQPGIDL